MGDKILMKFKEFQRLCFCNSDELLNKIFLINNSPHEWIGIGLVECDLDEKKPIIKIID